MIHTHQTAPTQFVEANSIRFAYRRFGKTGGVPLVFSQHYIGTMDYWDPTVTDGLARDHYCPVIASANRCNLLTAIEIGANSRRDDIFPAPMFSAKSVAQNAARQNAACWLAAPSSLS
jgi:hypothetical protein